MCSALRSGAIRRQKITINSIATYKPKKAFHKAFHKNGCFFTSNRASDHSEQRLRFWKTEALLTAIGGSALSLYAIAPFHDKNQLFLYIYRPL